MLAALLMKAGQSVPIGRLVDAIWNDDPPATAKNQVQTCVSKLRKEFVRMAAGEFIVTDPVGYHIRDPGDSLDLRRFQGLVRSAEAVAEREPETAVRHYRASLALWRGDALAEFDSKVIQPGALSLNEDRLAAYEALLNLELRLGRHCQVVGTLTELVARYPAHERFRAQLMLSLYRSGRQTEALEVFRAGREAKREEFGLDPSSELRALEQAILAGDRMLDIPGRPLTKIANGREKANPRPAGSGGDIASIPLPRQLPPAIADFTGRTDELARIGRALDPAAGAAPTRLVVLAGRGGAGKTALALQAAHAVRHAYPDGHLYVKFRDRSPAQILEGWLRAFNVAPAVIPADLANLAAMHRTLIGGRRVLIVVDDVADAADVEPLLPGIPGCAVIVTSRSATIRLPGAQRLNLGPLDGPLATRFLARAIGPHRAAAEPAAVRDLAELCDRQPLALRIVGTKLAERPHWTVQRMRSRLTDERRRLDELVLGESSVRDTLAFAWRQVSGDLRQLLTRLVLLDVNDFQCRVASVVMDVDLDEAEEMVAELVSVQLLEARPADSGAVRYRLPDLVRLYVAETCMKR